MTTVSVIKKIAVVASMVVLAACSSSEDGGLYDTYDTYDDSYEQPAGVSTGAVSQVDVFGLPRDVAMAEDERVIYFDYDSDGLSPVDQDIVATIGQYLVEHPQAKVVIEGHTDERGSAEYNIALGQRRAYAVSRAMMAAGAQPDQLTVISYGQERPTAQGHNESAWRLNRRAVIVYDEE